MIEIKEEYVAQIKWFGNSPDAGDPDCLCSYCGNIISEEEIPIRFFNTRYSKEARFHEHCFEIIAE